NRQTATIDAIIFEPIAPISPYVLTSNVPIKSPELVPNFFPSYNNPPNKPANASKLISYKLVILAKDNINPVTTPTVTPIASHPTQAMTNTIHRAKTEAKDTSYIFQPIKPVKIEASNIIMEITSSFFNVTVYDLKENKAILCVNIIHKISAKHASTKKLTP